MSSPGLHLVVQLYGKSETLPFERMLECIRRNSEFSFVKKITVLCEGERLLGGNKIRSLVISSIASYTDLMKIAQDGNTDEDITHFAVSNTDIFLTQGISCVMDKLINLSSVAAISRIELDGSRLFEPKHSQDLHLFKSHNFSRKVLSSSNYQLGIAGCENLFAMSLYSHGYNIWNPCLDCKIIHNDPSPRAQFSDRYSGAYLFLPPCNTCDVDSVSPVYEAHIARNMI
jgi:hypothetical protein